MSEDKKIEYKATPKAKALPRVLPLRRGTDTLFVGIGGDIKIEKKAPKVDRTIKEATAPQYKAAFEQYGKKVAHLIVKK